MNHIIKKSISNHPLFPNITRSVVIENLAVQAKYGQIVIEGFVQYLNENGEDVTSNFKSRIDSWIVDNSECTTVRDNKGNPVANPQYREAPENGEDNRSEVEKEPYLKKPSFDYFIEIIKNPDAPNLIKLLSMHIEYNDSIKFFDQLLGTKL